MIIDTHTHLNDKRFFEDLPEVLTRAKEAGICASIIPGADPSELERAVTLCETHENLFFSVGVHPYDCQSYDRSYLERYITHPKCVAVGECGLDYYRLPKDESEKIEEKRRQKEVFIDQIDLAVQYKKPLIIHIREASHDSLELLLQEGADQVGGVLHCFNASESLLSLAEQGFYFGIGGVVTFKNAKKLVQIVPKIPLDRILFETDAPYLTPHPHRGERNEPAYTKLVAKKVAEILEIDETKLEEIVLHNSKQLFKELEHIC